MISGAEGTGRLVVEAIAELNEQRDPGARVADADDTILFGEGGVLDSLGLVSLITILEEMLDAELEEAVSLVTEEALSGESQPFRSVGSLKKYVLSLLDRA